MIDDKFEVRVRHIHLECSRLISGSLGYIPQIAGNVAVFCKTEDEYRYFQRVAELLTRPSDNPAQKYFQLSQPIVIKSDGTISEARLEWLYIRKPAEDSPESGDVDYVLGQNDYDNLKSKVLKVEILNASNYNRPGWDMIEFKKEGYDGLPYVCTREMAEKVRVRF